MIHLLKDIKVKKIIIPIKYTIFIKGIKFLITHKPKDTIKKTISVIERECQIINYNQSYKIFLKRNKLSNKKIKNETKKIKSLKYQPKISLLMPTFNSPHKFLKMNLDSVINQIYSNWELCIADDCSSDPKVRQIIKEYSKKDKRIKYVFRNKNGHISRATNSCLKLATGEFVGLLDHDDLIYPNTLSECLKELNKHPDTDFIYTDEDKINKHNNRFEPHFKPNWSPETLLSGNYITHFALIRKKIINKVGNFRKGYEGAQDLDLFLRITEITSKIIHVPKILYSWRTLKTSTASKNSNAKNEYAYKNGTKAVQDCLNRRNLKSIVKIGEGKGLYQYFIENNDKKIDFFILKNKSKFSNEKLIKEFKKEFSKSTIMTSSNVKLGQKISNFIKNSKSDYIFFLDDQCYLNPKTIKSSIGLFKIKQIKIVTNKIIGFNKRIYKTGIIIVKNNNQINFIDAFYGIASGGYFNFNYSRMTKNFSATSLLGSFIKTKYFKKQNLNGIKKLNNLKEIGILLSSRLNKNRIVYNPNFPIIYKGKFINDLISPESHLNARKILKNKSHDPNYNPNLTIKQNNLNIDV